MNREKHFSSAASWADERDATRERSQRRAWIIVWILAGIAVAEAFALVALAPLKTVVPHTILVDRQTGFVTELDPARPAKLTADEALTRSFLVQYVAAREGFEIDSLRTDYRKVMSWSSGTARASYAQGMAATNPDSPLSRYARTTILEARPKSVSDMGDGSSMVRFDVVRSDGEGRAFAAVPYAAVIQHRFVPRQMSVEERFLNPLGFEVTRYRRDPEALPNVVANPSPSLAEVLRPGSQVPEPAQ